MPYNRSTGKITVNPPSTGQTNPLGVDIVDIMQATGCNVPDLGYCILYGTINIWSKFKPVCYNSRDTSDQWNFQQLKWKDSANWYMGLSSQLYGITPRSMDFSGWNESTFIGYYDGGLNGWTYTKPRGIFTISGVQYPFRETDFAGYNAKAIPPVDYLSVPAKTSVGEGLYIRVSAAINLDGSGYDSISLADLNVVGSGTNLYFGAVFIANDSSASPRTLLVTSDSVGGDVLKAQTSGTMLQKGKTYKVYPILSTRQGVISNDIYVTHGETRYTCPNCPVLETMAVDKTDQLDIDLDIVAMLTQAYTYNFRVINNNGADMLNLAYAYNQSSSTQPSSFTNWPVSTTVGAHSVSSTLRIQNLQTANTYMWIRFTYGLLQYYKCFGPISQYTPLSPASQVTT